MATNEKARMKRTPLEVAVFSCLIGAAAAAETTFEPRVTVSETRASNITLAPRGAEESEWITEAKPGFFLGRDGTRFDYTVDYDLQALFYLEDGDRNDVYHALRGEGQGEVVQDRVFVDLDAGYDQRTIDPANRQTRSNTFDAGNRTGVGTLRVSPWIKQPLVDIADATARYTWSQVDYEKSDDPTVNIQNSDMNRVDLGLASQDNFGWTWRMDYFAARIGYDDAADFEYERAGAEVGIPVAASSHALFAAGRESNPDESREGAGLDETWWTVGWQWAPTARQNLEVRAGDRYYGNTYDLSWRRSGTRGALVLDYHESPTTASELEFDSFTVTPDGIFGQARIDTRIFVRKRLSGLLTWTTSQSDWRLRLYREQRDYVSDAEADEEFLEDDEVYGIRAGWRWQAFSRTSLDTDALWEDQDFQEGEANGGRLSVALVRDLKSNLEGQLGAVRLFKNSEAIEDYRDTSVFLALTWYP